MNRIAGCAFALLFLLACGGDTIVIEPGDGTGTASDGTVSPLPTTDNSTSCNAIVQTVLVGQTCDTNADCGAGGRCVTQDAGAQGTCAQVCFPEQNCDTCGDTEACVRLIGTDGAALRFDLDSDGSAETVAGACQSREVVGNQGLFDPCGLDEGACADGYDCLQLEGRPTGTCFQICEGSCNPFDGELPVCSGSTSGNDVCLIACNDAPCPGGLECVDVAMGNRACMR